MEIIGDECILSFDVGPKDVGYIIGEKVNPEVKN